MQNRKRELIRFGKWTRNGIAFGTTWFLLLIFLHHSVFRIPVIRTDSLIRFFFWIVGGVLIFNLIFTRLLLKNRSFTERLTCFMVAISLYECLGFYRFGLFRGAGTLPQWGIFLGIVFVLYLICMILYQRYRKKRGEIYTRKLREYQSKRSMRHEQP